MRSLTRATKQNGDVWDSQASPFWFSEFVVSLRLSIDSAWAKSPQSSANSVHTGAWSEGRSMARRS